jgi:hypothetical protein
MNKRVQHFVIWACINMGISTIFLWIALFSQKPPLGAIPNAILALVFLSAALTE